MGIHSLYHLHNQVDQGNETHPTFYMHRKIIQTLSYRLYVWQPSNLRQSGQY
jgi:hypothetical protein